MRTIFYRVALVGLCVALGACSVFGPRDAESQTPAGTNFYVATDGNDAWSGSLAAPNAAKTDGPFATLERARDAVRMLKQAGPLAKPVTVNVRGGTYVLSRTFELGSQDSGTATTPVTYRAFGGEKPVLLGGRTVSGFVPDHGKVLKADVAKQGLRGVYFRQLFCDGVRQHLARYPNYDAANPAGGGWAYVDGKPIPMYKNIPDESKRTLVYKPGDARHWSRPQEAEVFVFPRYNWWNNVVPIKSIDPATHTITLTGDCSYPIRPGDRYYVQNALEELDAPGEWYLDRKSWTLYFQPPEGADPAKMTVVAPVLRNMVEIGPKTEHVTLRGFTMECAAGSAVLMNQASHCLVAGCTIRHVGDMHATAVVIHDGTDNGAVGNDISDVGNSAIAITGGDRKTLTPANNFAENNAIHDVGVYHKQGVGVALQGVGNRASHNLIYNCPRFGIQFGGNNLVMEYNHIHHVDLETADTGAIYTGGRDWISSRGSVIRYNYFHDIIGFGQEKGRFVSPHFAWGVYLDDNTGGVDVIGNIVVGAIRGLIHLHNGRDNHVINNVFIGGTLQQIELSGWTGGREPWTRHLPTMLQGYDAVKDQPAWKNMRGMQIDPRNAVLPDNTVMSGNVFERNIVVYSDSTSPAIKMRSVSLAHNRWDRNLYWHGGLPVKVRDQKGEMDWAAWQKTGEDAHSIIADPMFRDAAHADYRLSPDSPALKLGFEPIPVEKIGPYADPLRASWPVVEAPLIPVAPH